MIACHYSTASPDVASADSLCDRRIDYVDHPLFDHPEAEQRIEALKPVFEARSKSARAQPPSGLPPFLATLYQYPLLSIEEERYWFCRMNFLKFQAAQWQRKAQRTRRNERTYEKMQTCLQEALRIRNHVVRSNLRLAVSIAKGFTSPTLPLDELVGESHAPLIRAAELFDVSQGNRFCTYASWAIRNHLLRVRNRRWKLEQRLLFTNSIEAADIPSDQYDEHDEVSPNTYRQMEQRVKQLLETVSDRERTILCARFGLAGYGREHSFAEIGRLVQLSHERVRQINQQALANLREQDSDLGDFEAKGTL